MAGWSARTGGPLTSAKPRSNVWPNSATSCDALKRIYIRNGVYDLRVRVGKVNYRLLYFFHGRGIAILGHGLMKEKAVPRADIKRAIERKQRFEADPAGHTYNKEPQR